MARLFERPSGRIAAHQLAVTTRCAFFSIPFVESRTGILICEPTFPMYRYYRGDLRRPDFGARYAAKWNSRSKASSLRCVRSRGVLFIANPNNPTGTLLQKEECGDLESATHTAVVMDEAYAEFSGFTAMPWIGKISAVVCAKTFSKVAGSRPCVSAPCRHAKESLALVRRAMPPFPVNLACLWLRPEAALNDRVAMERYVRGERLRAWFAQD